MRFWDASAIVPLLVEEANTQTVFRLLIEDSDIAVWRFSVVEAYGASARRTRDGSINLDTRLLGEAHLGLLISGWVEIEHEARVIKRALTLLDRHSLKAADALQLGAAAVLRDDADVPISFVCLDQRLSAAARAEGFTVYP
jgi:predicted nucleic acid-binding protein